GGHAAQGARRDGQGGSEMSGLRTIGRLRWAAIAAGVGLLAGCGTSDETELRGWMNSVKQSTRVTTQPVPPPKEFAPFVYDSAGAAPTWRCSRPTGRRTWCGWEITSA